MRHQLIRIGPHQAGKILGIMYFLMGLLAAPFFLFGVFFGSEPGLGGLLFAIAIPFLYGAIGYVFVALGALVYNALAKVVGGLEITVQAVDQPQAL